MRNIQVSWVRLTPDQTLVTLQFRRELSEDDLLIVSDHVGEEWENLGKALKMNEAQLSRIEHDHQTLREKVKFMLCQ